MRTAYKCRAYPDQEQASDYLTAIKTTEELAWLNEVSSVPLQQAIRHQAGFRWRDGRLFLAKMGTPLAFT
jgi:putative transposase